MNIEFIKIAEDSYVVYKNGARVAPFPLNKEELHDKILELDSDGYEGGDNDEQTKAKKESN